MTAIKPDLVVASPYIQGVSQNPDLWLATRAKIVLFTTSGLAIEDGFIEGRGGVVTLRGSVPTTAQKERAETVVGGIDGVKGVRNFLRVVAPTTKAGPDDQKIKERVEKALRSDEALDGLKVAEVNHGVVSMSGRGVTMTGRLRAVEMAWNVAGAATDAEADSLPPSHGSSKRIS